MKRRFFLLAIVAVTVLPLAHGSPSWCGYSYGYQTRTTNYADAEIGLIPDSPSGIWFSEISWGDSLSQVQMQTGPNGFSCYQPPSNVAYYHALHQYTQNGTYTVIIDYAESLQSIGSVNWTWTITITTPPTDSSAGGGAGRSPLRL